MNVEHNLTDTLYAMHDAYTGMSARYERMKRGNLFIRHIGLLPCKLKKKLLMDKIRATYERADSLSALSGDSGIVVSLTSFPARIKGLHLVIRSLLTQTLLPGKIVLYLSANEFPRREADLPSTLLDMKRLGFEVRFEDGNLRSHKKYHYAFSNFPDSIVITVDDDIIYPQYTIQRLMELHMRHPEAVCANIIRVIGFDNGRFKPYKQWRKYTQGNESCSKFNTAIGCGGVLYPPRWYDDTLFDTGTAMRLSPYADDLWLKAHQLRRNVSVAFPGKYFPKPIELPGTERSSLQRRNNSHKNMNDTQWEMMDREFGLTEIAARLAETADKTNI